MKILSIETSCDETAVAILAIATSGKSAKARILANLVHSQISIHAPYGGVFPTLAKREHAKNLIPILIQALQKAKFLKLKPYDISKEIKNHTEKILTKEPELLAQFLSEIPSIKKPPIDAIAVTYGPGLEPALWVGVNFAKALSYIWDIPIVAVNHMEGHVFSALLKAEKKISNSKFLISKQIQNTTYQIPNIQFPALALLVSGGHTELVLMKDRNTYNIIGQTLDDAVGEAFDKVARMLSLPYPGGPAVAALAETAKNQESVTRNYNIRLPRPMIDRPNFDFSFSGLKTAVLYLLKDYEKAGVTLNKNLKANICREFQQAAIDVLLKKTIASAKKYSVKTLLIGGGVSANNELRKQFQQTIKKEIPDACFLIPDVHFTGDNAAMIALAAYFKKNERGNKTADFSKLAASGNVRIDTQKMPAVFLPRAS